MQGYHYYLCLQPSTSEWKLGAGKKPENKGVTYEGVTYTASGGDGDPSSLTNISDWKSDQQANPPIWYVIKKTSVASTLNQTKANQGFATLDGGAICVEKISKKWIMLDGDDARMCDSNEDCEGAWDEDCLGEDFEGPETLVIEGGESRIEGEYNLTRSKESIPLFYSRVGDWGYISVIRWWRGGFGSRRGFGSRIGTTTTPSPAGRRSTARHCWISVQHFHILHDRFYLV